MFSPNKKKFRLIDVFERAYGKPPDVSHYAEADTLVLLQCVVAQKLKFVKIACASSKLFNEIKS